jgi:hypothetical protein
LVESRAGSGATLAYQRQKITAGEATRGEVVRTRLSYVVRAGFVVVGVLYASSVL